RRLCLLFQRRKCEGCGTGRQSPSRNQFPLEDAQARGPGARPRDAGVGRGSRRLFRHPSQGQPNWSLGLAAIARHGRPLCVRKKIGRIRHQICVEQSAASALLDRLAHRAAAHRILARPSVPPARPPGLSARRAVRALAHRTAVSVKHMRQVGEDRLQQAGGFMRRAAIASLSVSLFLVAIKTFAYFASHSVALLASLADSALDLFTSWLNLVAIRQSLTPADAEHRFGHGKAEPLAGLAQGAFITASALFLVIQAVNRIIVPEPIDHSLLALVVMCIAITCAIGLILYERKVVAKTGSLAVEADQTHYFADLVTNIGVVLA